MARDITITLTADNRLKFASDIITVPDWYVPLAGAAIHGTLDQAYIANAVAVAAGEHVNQRATYGPRVMIESGDGQGREWRIYLNRIKAAGAFAAWTPGEDQAALEAFIDILEPLV